jgi:hypothetical protein
MAETLAESVVALDHKNASYFKSQLGAKEAWRAWPEFQSDCCYLDIETDGGMSGSSVTTIGLYDGNRFTCLVRGQDLEIFPDYISRFKYLVTFYGTGFDLPMLQKAFPGLRFPQIHLDLCFALKRLGYRGGLKRIEKQLGISRGDETDGLSGLDAIRLWREYQLGREESLRTLIEYNQEDVVNLEILAQLAFDQLKEATLSGSKLR